jgi:hypothetical protein
VPPSGIPQDLQKQTPASPTGKDLSAKIDSSMVAGLRNISFYDPHRPKRYWSSQNSRHTTLKDAVDALAAIYGRSSEWVEANMGDENDLGSIHLRLLAAQASGTTKENRAPNVQPELPEPVFHDDGRDLQQPALPESAPEWKSLDMPEDLRFYDPRRERKYWIDSRSRFDTYGEATAALASQYGVPVQWIEAHIGHTNRLKEIHVTIRNTLSGHLSGKGAKTAD